MSPKKPAIHTVHNRNGGWDNKVEGKAKPIEHFDTKAKATEAGRQAAINTKTEHVIHNMNGQIRQKNSYGPDPCPPKDKR